MEIILETVKHMAIFILLFSFVKHLYLGSSYEKYFSYLEGILLFVLLLTPLVQAFTNSNLELDFTRENEKLDKIWEGKIEDMEKLKWEYWKEEKEHE